MPATQRIRCVAARGDGVDAAVSANERHDGATTGKKPPGTDLLNRYMERLNIAAQHDDLVALRFNEVAALVRRPESLLAPRLFLRVRAAARRGVAEVSEVAPAA